jgi:ABC-type sugar transport system ATPase subunit
METVSRLNQEKGITVVLITHHMDEAARAERVVVLHKGKVAADGSPREVFSQVELLHSIGSCVYPGVYLAKQAYLAGIYFAKIWDVAGILPALKNLGFCSVSEDGSDLMSLKISSEVYDMDISSKTFLKMKGIHVISSTEESCRRIAEKITFPERS